MPRKKISRLAWFVLLFSLAIAALFLARASSFYSQLRFSVDQSTTVTVLLRAQEDEQSCQSSLDRMVAVVGRSCGHCKIETAVCERGLSGEQERLLSQQPVSMVTARLPQGVVAFTAADTEGALASCRQYLESGVIAGAKCFGPGEERRIGNGGVWENAVTLGKAFLVLVLAQIMAKLVCYLIIRYEHLHAHLSHDATGGGPQKFHAVPTPRIGGVALMAGVLISGAGVFAFSPEHVSKDFGLLVLASMPAFLGGLTEDITKRVSVMQRLLLTMLSAGFGGLLLGAVLPRLDIPGVDMLMQWLPFAVLFTVFAVAGVTNSINIIDGYNGLAGGFGVIVLAALAYVSAQVGDSFLLTANLSMMGALLGFLVWNWPGGKIFLGDGGAYFLGFWISEMAVLLIVRHPEVSAWFALLVMGYPVFETLFSIYRRKVKRNQHPGHPDAMHMHQLIYRRFVRIHIGSKQAQHLVRRNSRVAPYIWTVTGFAALCGVAFWDSPLVLAMLLLAGCGIYVWIYRQIAHWNVPDFVKISDKLPPAA